MPEAVAEQAEKELRRLERQGEQSPESSMIRSYLDWLIAVPWCKRSEERLDPVHTREVLDADHAGLDDVKRRITEFIAVRKLREERGKGEEDSRANGAILTLVGPPGHRQDLDRRVDRPRPRARVRPHQPRRPARRGRDPRPPPHLHRRPAGTDRPRPARRQDDEPGDPARRGRQGRRRLARRPLGGPARGAGPGAEPLVPRPLPRRRGRPLRGRLPRHREPDRHDPGAVAGPDGDDRLRRLHDRREAGDRPRLPAAAAAEAQRPGGRRGRGQRGDPARRRSPSTPARPACASSSASSASCCAARRRGSPPARPRARS